jgi:hypothetical protein
LPIDPVALRTEAEVLPGSEYVGRNTLLHHWSLDLLEGRVANRATGKGSVGLPIQFGDDLFDLLFQLLTFNEEAVQPAPAR